MVPHSHLEGSLGLAYCALLSRSPKLARAWWAERASRRAAPGAASSGPAAFTRASRAPHAPLLAAAYALAPVLAFVTWRALTPVFPGGTAVSAAGSVLLLLPPLVHVAHGATKRAGRVLVSLVGYLALGGVGGAALGRTLALASCDSGSSGECGLTVLVWLLLGAASGGLLGYCIHAVRQVRAAEVAPG